MEFPYFTSFMTLVALGQFFWFSLMVGRARSQHNVPAPATYGNPEFERVFRVQQNTMEQLVLFLPSLWLFGVLVNDLAAGILAIIWVLGREFYGMNYIKNPDSRGRGFIISIGSTAVLFFGALVSVVMEIISHYT